MAQEELRGIGQDFGQWQRHPGEEPVRVREGSAPARGAEPAPDPVEPRDDGGPADDAGPGAAADADVASAGDAVTEPEKPKTRSRRTRRSS